MNKSTKHSHIDILETLRKIVFVFGSLAFFLGSATYGAHFYLNEYSQKVFFEKKSGIGTKDDVAINFSVPVLGSDYLKNIKVSPDNEVDVHFENSNRKIVITPLTFWKPEVEYSVSLPDGRTTMLTKIPARKFVFSTASYPRITSIYPANSSKDVTIGAEEPITVNFNKSTKGFFVKFSLNPDSEIVYQNNPEKTEFKLLPKNAIADGTHYELKIFVKVADEGDEGYRQVYSGYFDTLPSQPVFWEKDYTLRLAQVKRFTRAKITEGKYIDVNLSTQTMTLFEDGKALDSYLISSGKRGMETPKGEHQIYNKAPRAYSKEYGLYMPNWMAILPDGKVGIHELPEWPGGYKEGASHLGIPVSHGCIRLGVGPAAHVYEWADIGTKVIVY